MTDTQLHSMTVNQLRARFNSAPGYLQQLLQRKRMLDEGIVWEMSLAQRATAGRVSGYDENSTGSR